jgi:hypothetical protein
MVGLIGARARLEIMMARFQLLDDRNFDTSWGNTAKCDDR